MDRFQKSALLVIAGLGLAACAHAEGNPQSAPAPASTVLVETLPGWMAGAWVEAKGEKPNQQWAEEFWSPPRGGIMLGAGRSGSGVKLRSWEAMQIRANANGKLAFYGMPGGAMATEFTLVRSGAREVVFENPVHDYPQRIRYWREGRLLHAETALADGSKAMRWTYRPMGE